MSKLSSNRLNFARKGHERVARAHSYFANIPEGVRHILMAVVSSSSKLGVVEIWQSALKIPPNVRSVQSSDFYRPRISNQPIFTGKCVRSMKKEQ